MSAEANNQERYEELLTGYVCGTLTRIELIEFHGLQEKGLPAGTMSVEEAQYVLAELPEALHAPALSVRLKERVMARAFIEAPPEEDLIAFQPAQERKPSRIPALAWAAIILLGLTNVAMFVQTLRIHNQFRDVAKQNQNLRDDMFGFNAKAIDAQQTKDDAAKLKAELARLKLDLQNQTGMNEMLTNPSVLVSNMKGTKTDCRARVYFDPDARIVLVCSSSLPNLEPGKDYQLWAMVGGKPVSIGVLRTRRGNSFHLNAPPAVPLDKVTTFAISKEPTGGMPQPTGEIIFAGL